MSDSATPKAGSPREETEMSIDGVAWLLIRNGSILLERCPKKAEKLGVGEWFVPGGKTEGDETAEEALRREVREEWPSVELQDFDLLPIVQASRIPPGPKGIFLMQPFVVFVSGQIPSHASNGVELRWTPLSEALASPVPQVRMMVAAASIPVEPIETAERTEKSESGVNQEGVRPTAASLVNSKNHTPGRELDALIAERVMGLTGRRIVYRWIDRKTHSNPLIGFDRSRDWEIAENSFGAFVTVSGENIRGGISRARAYSSHIESAWIVVEKLASSGLFFQIARYTAAPPGSTEKELREAWRATFSGDTTGDAWAETAPLAICLAALRALDA